MGKNAIYYFAKFELNDHFNVIFLLEMIIPNLVVRLIVTTLLSNVILPFPTTFEIYICPSTLVTVE